MDLLQELLDLIQVESDHMRSLYPGYLIKFVCRAGEHPFAVIESPEEQSPNEQPTS